MLEILFNDVYEKFKLNFYKNIFKNFETREATLSATETFCVEVINALGRPTISELTNFLEISQPNTAYKVANLVKKGYVEKIQSTEDKREYYLELTDKFQKYQDIKNSTTSMRCFFFIGILFPILLAVKIKDINQYNKIKKIQKFVYKKNRQSSLQKFIQKE